MVSKKFYLIITQQNKNILIKDLWKEVLVLHKNGHVTLVVTFKHKESNVDLNIVL